MLKLTPDQLAFRRWLDTRLLRFPGEPDRTCDTVAHVEDLKAGGVPWVQVLEFQIAPDPLMFGRLLGYFGPLWVEYKPAPERGDRFSLGGIVVNLTSAGRSSQSMDWPATGQHTGLTLVERNLAAESAADTLQAIAAGTAPAVILPWIPLMSGGADAEVIAEWKRLAERETDPRLKSDLGGLALVFSEAAGHLAVWKEALKEWNMIQSKQVLEWQAQARSETQVTTLSRSVMRVLEARFGNVPPDLSDRVRAVSDAAALDQLLVAAARSPSLEEFLRSWSN